MLTSSFVAILCILFHLTAGQSPTGERANQTAGTCNGVPGRDGRDGPQGPPGFPGYPGRRGEPGHQGIQGIKGERGDTGTTGVVGPRGIPGQKGQKGSTDPSSSGVLYTRWGKNTCRSGASLVYAGIAGGSYHRHGGGSNYLCMPSDPEYELSYSPGVQGYSYVYGVEYEQTTPVRNRNNHNAQCAVCLVSDKEVLLMIPAKIHCPSGWTREYYGYLMAEHIEYSKRTEYVCVDQSMDVVPGSQNHISSSHFWHVEGHCDGVPCPPYNNYKELNCVVCTK